MNYPELPNFIASMHIASRLFVGAVFLLVAVFNHTVLIALMQLALFIGALLVYENGRSRILRAIGLLRWLVLPTILLHTLFTPGALIIAGMALPVSVEGLQAGFWFSLHLMVIFFAAMLFSQLLSRREWLKVSLKIPGLGHRLLPFALLMNRCWQRIRLLMDDEYARWRSEKQRFRKLFVHLGEMPLQALKLSREVAGEIWNDWDRRVLELTGEGEGRQVSVVTTFTALSAALLIGLVTLYGGI